MAGSSGTGADTGADMAAHVATYGSLIDLLKWGAVGVFIIAAFVIWLIS